MTARKLLLAASLIFVALPAAAEDEDSSSGSTVSVAADGSVLRGNASSPWRGTSISYGQLATTISIDKAAEQTWNPYYAHGVTLAPRYYLSEELYLFGSWRLEQELTDSDWTRKKNEVMWSDISLALGWSGWAEPNTGIRISSSLALGLPVSKVSSAQTTLLSVAPSVRLARRFDVLDGLTVGWNARYTQRFHEETTARFDGIPIQGGCEIDCDRFRNTGILNSWGDLSTGPSISLVATESLSFTADMRWAKSWLYDADVRNPITGEKLGTDSDFSGRYSTYFGLGAGYDLMDEITLGAGVATPSPQLGLDGERRSPFFNRYTQVYFDLQMNLSALGIL